MSKTNSIISSSKSIAKEQSQLSVKSELERIKLYNKMKSIAWITNRLFTNKLSSAWAKLKNIPLRRLKIQDRMKSIVQNLYKKQDFVARWDAFQKCKRTAIASQQKQVLHYKQTLKKQRATAIRLITAFFLGKKRNNLYAILKKFKEFGDWKQFNINTNFRKAFRIIIKIHQKKVLQTFNRIKTTKVIIHFVRTCRGAFRILKEIKLQNTRWAFLGLRRQMLRSRKEKVTSQIKQLEEKLGNGEDEELKLLKQKHNELVAQLEEIKKEKDQIAAGFDAEVKQAQNRNKQMKEKLQQHKIKQEQMKKRIAQIDQSMKVPFSLQEIYQLCYENFLWTVSQSNEKNYSKAQLLKSLETPLIPIDLPIEQLKQENQVLKDLLSQYMLLYGQKKIPQNAKIELPYEYLLKQNNVLYKMLMTLLPNAQFLKDQLLRIRQTFQNVQSSLKQIKPK